LQKTSHPHVSKFLLSPSAFCGSLFFLSHRCLVSRQPPLLQLIRHQLHHASRRPLADPIMPKTVTVSSLQNSSSFPPWSTPTTVPPSDTAQTINSTSWSRPRILHQVSRSSVNLYFLQPFWLQAECELLFTFWK